MISGKIKILSNNKIKRNMACIKCSSCYWGERIWNRI